MDRPATRQINWRWQEVIGLLDKKTLSGHQSVFFNRLMDLGDPVEEYDAVNKKYVDGYVHPEFDHAQDRATILSGAGSVVGVLHGILEAPTIANGYMFSFMLSDEELHSIRATNIGLTTVDFELDPGLVTTADRAFIWKCQRVI